MKKILWIITLLTVSFLVSCSSNNETSIQEQVEETPKGYVLTSKVFILKEPTEKPSDNLIDHFEKEYVTKNKIRIDHIYTNYEIRHYKIIEDGKITTTGCNNEQKTWICKEIIAGVKVVEAEPIKRLTDVKDLTKLKALPDKEISSFAAKCFKSSESATFCFHPNYYIKLYENRNNHLIGEATSLEFAIPDEKVFELPADAVILKSVE